MNATDPFPAHQEISRQRLYKAHCANLDLLWNPDGTFRRGTPWTGAASDPAHGFRGSMWHCLAYLAGDEKCRERANRIIEVHATPGLCHFAPGVAVEILLHYPEALEPATRSLLETYVAATVPQLVTDDLKVHGYNDNHPFKAVQALILGGEYLDRRDLVEAGLRRLENARKLYLSNGFPCEYNSPTYTAVSLQPLAGVVNASASAEARELALWTERFFWRDLALHFDGRCGVCAGPMSRAGMNDSEGMVTNTLMLLMHLWPERFALDLATEIARTPGNTRISEPEGVRTNPAFLSAHAIWVARPDYHVTAALEEAIFAKAPDTVVRGTSESGTIAVSWAPGDEVPRGAPEIWVQGPRRSLLTTFFGGQFSLGTSRYGWLDNSQAHAFYATAAAGRPGDRGLLDHANAAVYFARHFADDLCPYLEAPGPWGTYFRDMGEPRTLQHRNTAMVFYHAIPRRARIRNWRTGIFRPLRFHAPLAVCAGDVPVRGMNFVSREPLPVAIEEENVYIGIIPLLGPPLAEAQRARLRISSHGGVLAVYLSSCETWGPEEFSFREQLEARSGFVFEIHPKSAFPDFAAFRAWLGEAKLEDDYFSLMRTTTYRRPGLELSSVYSPWHPGFRHLTINGVPDSDPAFEVVGSGDPLNGL